MANKYTRKGRERGNAPAEALPVDDQFVSLTTRAMMAAEPYFKQIGIGLAIAAGVCGLIWAGMSWSNNSREQATEMFGRAVRTYEADLLGADEKADKAKSEEDVPRFKTAKERSDATLAALDELEKKHGGSAAAHESLAFRAGVLYDRGDFAEAEKAWRKTADQAAKDDPVRVVAKEGVGLCLENQGKLDDALAIYKEIEGAGGGFFKDRAQYDQARALSSKGSKAEAEKLLKDILARVPQGGFHDEVQTRLDRLNG